MKKLEELLKQIESAAQVWAGKQLIESVSR